VNESSDDNLALKKVKEEEWGRVGEGGGQCKVRYLPICAMKEVDNVKSEISLSVP
jgi:hypothetical protein